MIYYITITNHRQVPGIDTVYEGAPKSTAVCNVGDIVILPGMSITMTCSGTIFLREEEVDGRCKS